jgi:hypothetical protein
MQTQAPQQQATPEQCLAMLDSTVSGLRVSRQEHQQLTGAVQILAKALAELKTYQTAPVPLKKVETSDK